MRTLRTLAVLAVMGFASAAFATDQIDNPEYARWSQYKPGTFVTTQQTMDMPGMAAANPNMPAGMNMASMMPQTKTTTKLTEVKPDALTLEVSIDTTQAGRTTSNKTTRTVTAKIDKPATTAPAVEGVQGEVKDLKEGKETVDLKGAKVDTVTKEFTTVLTGSPMAGGRAARGGGPTTPTTAHMKIWTSTTIPGGMVKTETTTTVEQMGDMKITQTVVDYDIAK